LPSTQQRPQWQLVTRLHASLCAEAVLLAQGAPPVVSSRALLRLRKLPAGPAVDVSPGDGSSAAAAAATAAEGSDDEDAASLRRLIARQHPQLLPYRPAGGFVDEETAAAASGDGATTASTRARVSTSSSSKHTTVPPSPAAQQSGRHQDRLPLLSKNILDGSRQDSPTNLAIPVNGYGCYPPTAPNPPTRPLPKGSKAMT
jgi:hypothetical protein